MLSNKVVCYNAGKTLALADYTIENICSEILYGRTTDIISDIRRLCGTLCYRSLFTIPAYELVDGKKYTIEKICYYAPKLFKMTLHDFLLVLSELSLGNKGVNKMLREMLSDNLYGEVMAPICSDVGVVYLTLVLGYYSLEPSQNISLFTKFVDEYQKTGTVRFDEVFDTFYTIGGNGKYGVGIN